MRTPLDGLASFVAGRPVAYTAADGRRFKVRLMRSRRGTFLRFTTLRGRLLTQPIVTESGAVSFFLGLKRL